jgi:soluble lytic murein transglycosylase
MSLDAAMSRIGEIQALEATLVQAPPAAAPQPSAQPFSQVLAQAQTGATAQGLPAQAQQFLPQVQQAAARYGVDPALIEAVIQQESGFDPNATSPAGAAGLMQLMPTTARVMGKGAGNVFDPDANLTLGQRYVDLLLKHDRVKGNLLSLIAAYNVGPGNLTPSPGEDPLLLIESMPSAETRQLVQRVLTNFWIYQLRFGQPTDSLDQVAQGEMPVYIGTRVGDTALAERNGRN